MARARSRVRRRPRVALIIETSLASGRDILEGIAQHLHEHARWSVFHEPRSVSEAVPGWLRNWKGDGIIARLFNRNTAEAVVAAGVPAVDVLGMFPHPAMPLVHVDDQAIAAMAAQHLLDRGFRQFGFCGIAGANWSDRRALAFAAAVQRAGCSFSQLLLHPIRREGWSWEQEQQDLVAWLRALPRPAGVMVCSDQRGQHVIEACRRAGLLVPDEIAVVGVDDDRLLCDFCDPPLSSVDPGHRQLGYRAAMLLDQLMHGQAPPAAPTLLPPVGIVIRRSSDTLAIPDPQLVQALHFIGEHACEGIEVGDVARAASLSVRTLHRRFQRALGRSPHEEILRHRLQRAQELLLKTRLPLGDVAIRCGFGYAEYLSVVFKQRLGITPGKYRSASQAPGAKTLRSRGTNP